MKQRLCNFIICILVVVGIFSLYTCAFTGDVYIGFFWASDASDKPTGASNFTAIPNAPTDPTTLVNGGYFLTLPGTFTITYTAVGGNSYPKTITLKAASAVGGFETTYYNVFLSNATGVKVEEGP